MRKKIDESIGPCGLYCGICTMYRTYHDRNLNLWRETPENFRKRLGLPEEVDFKDIACEGCRSSMLFKYCSECSIRECISKKEIDWCYECKSFPCERLSDFQSYWRVPIIDNLREIKKIGVKKWLREKDKKWRCSKCGTKLHWFSFGICPKCGETVPDPGER